MSDVVSQNRIGSFTWSMPRATATGLAKAYGWLCLEIWLLIALGGGVRAMNAGLACPDWPLCFGDVIPDYHPQVYFEFIHRAMAAMVGVASLLLAVLVWKSSQISRRVKWLSLLSLVLLSAQIVLGGLTVLLLLHEKVVAGHLFLAAAFLICNLWIYLELKTERKVPAAPMRYRLLSRLTFATVVAQMTLGGLVASHSAALVCTDFPLCHGQFIPTLSGILGLHIWHRLGAYATGLMIFALGVWSWRTRKDRSEQQTRLARGLILLVIWQIGVGIANLVFYTPPLLTVIHLASGMALLAVSAAHVFYTPTKINS